MKAKLFILCLIASLSLCKFDFAEATCSTAAGTSYSINSTSLVSLGVVWAINPNDGLLHIVSENSDCTIGGSGGSSPAVAFTPTPNGNVTTLAVTTTSANVALPTGTADAITNTGNVTVYTNLGASSVTAGISNYGIAPGATVYWTPGTATYIAGITASGSSSLQIIGGSLAGSGSGSVTITQPAGTTTVPSPINVTTSSTTVVPASTGTRLSVTIFNNSSTAGNIIWCRSDGGTAVVGQGVPIQPNNGWWNWSYPLVASNTSIPCIATSATASVSYEADQ